MYTYIYIYIYMCIYDLYITIYACIYLYVRNILILILLLVHYYVSVRKIHLRNKRKKISNDVSPLFHIPLRNPFATRASPFLFARSCTCESIISENAPNVYCLPFMRRFVFVREICFYICTYRDRIIGGNIDDRAVKIN